MSWCFSKRCLFWLVALLALGWLGVFLWYLVPPQPRFQISIPPSSIHLAPDGRIAALFAPNPNQLQIWDTVKGGLLQKFLLDGKPEAFEIGEEPFFFSPDKRYLVFSQQNIPVIYDMVADKVNPIKVDPADYFFKSGQKTLFGLFAESEGMHVVEFASGRILKKYGRKGEQAWDDETMQLQFSLNEELNLYINYKKSQKPVWVDDLKSGKTIQRYDFVEGNYFFSRGNRYLAVLGSNKEETYFQAWDLGTGRETFHWKWKNEVDFPERKWPFFSEDDYYFFLQDRRQSLIELVETATGDKRVLSDPALASEDILTCSFSSDGRYLAVGSSGRRVSVFEWRAGKKLWEKVLPVTFSDVVCFNTAFSHDGKSLSVVWEKGLEFSEPEPFQVEYFDTVSGKPLGNVFIGITPLSFEREDVANLWPPFLAKWFGQRKEYLRITLSDPITNQKHWEVRLENMDHAQIAQDNRTLATFGPRGWYFWDVPLRPPLYWVVGPPLILGLFLGLLSWRLRTKK